jgi:hypothetical protein
MTIRLADAARWDQQLPHQLAAWNWLQEQLTAEQLDQFAETYRSGPPASEVPRRPTNPLTPFAYFPQADNGPEAWRQCQTSAIAMCLAYLKTPGIKDDTDYLRVVERYGDTTEQATHQLALKALGVRARFRQDMTQGQLMAEIKAGLPVAMGLLHRGPVSAPSGGGHWVTCFGFNAETAAYVVHDPYGELDLVNGGWAAVGGLHGMGRSYSFKNTNPRWMVEGDGSGWGWTFS